MTTDEKIGRRVRIIWAYVWRVPALLLWAWFLAVANEAMNTLVLGYSSPAAEWFGVAMMFALVAAIRSAREAAE